MKNERYKKWMALITFMVTVISISVCSIAYMKSHVKTDYLSSNNVQIDRPTLITFYKKGCSYCNAAKPGLISDLSVAQKSGLNVYLLDEQSNEAKRLRSDFGLNKPYTGIVYWNKDNSTIYTYSFPILKQNNKGKYLKEYNHLSVQAAITQLQVYNNEYSRLNDLKRSAKADTRETMKLHKKDNTV